MKNKDLKKGQNQTKRQQNLSISSPPFSRNQKRSQLKRTTKLKPKQLDLERSIH